MSIFQQAFQFSDTSSCASRC